MLKSLYVNNYLLIEELNVSFNKGLTIITGETGSGKSLIIDSLSLISGKRADVSQLKKVDKKCIVEGVFKVKEKFKKEFEKNSVEYDAETIIRREILQSGKSRAFINDSPVTLDSLRLISSLVLNFHSQHQNLLLNKEEFQLSVLDLLAENKNILTQTKKYYLEKNKIEKKLFSLNIEKSEMSDKHSYYEFLYKELVDANLKLNEKEELEEKVKLQSSSEDIKQKISSIFNKINVENFGLNRQFDELSSFLPSISKQLAKQFQSAKLEIDDVLSELSTINENLSFNKDKNKRMSDRISLIYTLERKHNVNSVKELLDKKEELLSFLSEGNNVEQEIKKLNTKLVSLNKQIHKTSVLLNKRRVDVKDNFENIINALLIQLGIKNAQFKIEINKKEFSQNGCDEISFLFTANKGSIFQEISKVASGGELSRLMLCIKYAIANKGYFSTIVLDEIDSGVSGKIAEKVGALIYEISKTNQVLCITHLPQVASKGNEHFLVEKQISNNKTITSLRKLNPEKRTNEIAKLLSGSMVTNAAIQNAKELLNN